MQKLATNPFQVSVLVSVKRNDWRGYFFSFEGEITLSEYDKKDCRVSHDLPFIRDSKILKGSESTSIGIKG